MNTLFNLKEVSQKSISKAAEMAFALKRTLPECMEVEFDFNGVTLTTIGKNSPHDVEEVFLNQYI